MTTIHEKYSLDGNNTEVNPLPAVTGKLRALKISIDPTLTVNAVPPVTELLQNVIQFSDHLADAANKVLDGEDPTESMVKYVTMAHIQGLSEEIHRQHRLRQVDALNAAADTIIQTIRTEVFEPAIERLTELSEDHDGGWDLGAAIEAKDFTAAAVIDEAIQLVARLRTADEARRLLHPGAFNGPAAYGLAPDVSLAGEGSLPWWIYLAGIGPALTFPTLTEWYRLHHSQAHRDYRDAETDKAEADKPEAISLGYTSH